MAGWLLYQHRTGEDTHVAVFIPLIALALPVLPVSYETNALAVGFVYSSVWLSWITLSSIQLSELKYEFQLSDLTLAFGEKCLVMVAILVGSIVGTTVLNGLDPSSFGLAVPYAVAVVPACFSAFMLLKLTSARTHEAVVKTLITNENDQLECIYRTIADTYGLSRREQEDTWATWPVAIRERISAASWISRRAPCGPTRETFTKRRRAIPKRSSCSWWSALSILTSDANGWRAVERAHSAWEGVGRACARGRHAPASRHAPEKPPEPD